MDRFGMIDLSKYNPLDDPNLTGYFQSPQMQKHLRKMGLCVNKLSSLIDATTHRVFKIDPEGNSRTPGQVRHLDIQKKHEITGQASMTRQIITTNRDFQLGRQLELQRQLDAVSKVQTYRSIKGIDLNSDELKEATPNELDQAFVRTRSLPPTDHHLPKSANKKTKKSNGYLTDEDIPKSQSANIFNSNHVKRYLDDVQRYQHLHKLDVRSLRHYRQYLLKELRQMNKARDVLPMISPESSMSSGGASTKHWQKRRTSAPNWRKLRSPINGIVAPKKFLGSRSNSRSLRSSTAQSYGSRRAKSHSPKRHNNNSLPPLSANNRTSRVTNRLYTVSAGNKKKRRNNQPMCACFLQYQGRAFSKTPRDSNGSEGESPGKIDLTINQQHCGGNPIVVFKEEVTPGALLYFFSYRHVGFPFSLSFVENGEAICRFNACCESRYSPKTKLGGKQGVVKWLGVRNALPCYNCQLDREFKPPYTNYEPRDKSILESVIAKEKVLASKNMMRPGTTLPMASAKVPLRMVNSGMRPSRPEPKPKIRKEKPKKKISQQANAAEKKSTEKNEAAAESNSEKIDNSSDSEDENKDKSEKSLDKSRSDSESSLSASSAVQLSAKKEDDISSRRATQIQASYRGYMTRKRLRDEGKLPRKGKTLENEVEVDDDIGDRLQTAGSAMLALEQKYYGNKEAGNKSKTEAEVVDKSDSDDSAVKSASEVERKKSNSDFEEDSKSKSAVKSNSSEDEDSESESEEESETESEKSEKKSKSESEKSETKSKSKSESVSNSKLRDYSRASKESESESEDSKSEAKLSNMTEDSELKLKNAGNNNSDSMIGNKRSHSSSEGEDSETKTVESEKPIPKAVLERKISQRSNSRKDSHRSTGDESDESDDDGDGEWLCEVCNFENPADREECWICKAKKGEKLSSEGGESESETENDKTVDESKSKESKSSGRKETEKENLTHWPDARSTASESSHSDRSKSCEKSTSDKNKNSSNKSDSDSAEDSDSDKDTLADAQSIYSEADEHGPSKPEEKQSSLGPPDIQVQPATPVPAGTGTKQKSGPKAPTNSAVSQDKKAKKPESESNFKFDSLESRCQQEEVILSGTDVSDIETAFTIAKCLRENHQLKSLSLRSCKLTEKTLRAVVDGLQSSKAPIRVLNISDNHLPVSTAHDILHLIKDRPLEILMLHDNVLGDQGLKILLEGVIEMVENEGDRVALRRIDIGENRMGDEAASRLVRLLSICPTIRSINLGGNNGLSIDSWSSIGQVLAYCQIEALNLDYCQMGDQSIEHLCQGLKNMKTLKFMDLDGNDITEKGGAHLTEMVRSCPNLRNVVLTAGNSISTERQHTLHQIFNSRQVNTTIEKDFLGVKPMDYVKFG